MPHTRAEELSDYISALRYSDLPEKVVSRTKLAILDTLGCALFGSSMPWAKAVYEVARGQGGTPEATIWRYGDKTSCSNAVFANGTFAHSNDYDDCHVYTPCHAGNVVVSTALAIAERERRSGKEIIASIVLGYDVFTRLSLAVHSTPNGRATFRFQDNAVFGPFAAAAVAARLLGLDRQQTTWALGLAGGYAGGTREFRSDGSDSKRFYSGKPAQGGVLSALLAQAGFTGPKTIFEGSAGIFAAVTQDFDVAKVTEDLGKRFDVLDYMIKTYPVYGVIGGPVESALTLVRQQQLDLDKIERIKVGVISRIYNSVWASYDDPEWRYRPPTVLHAQRSLPYLIALALINKGKISWDMFAEQSARDNPDVVALARKVEVHIDPEQDALLRAQQGGRPSATEIRMRGGEVYSHRNPFSEGDPSRPLSPARVEQKFMENALSVLDEKRASRLAKAVSGLDSLEVASDLTSLLLPGQVPLNSDR